MRAPEPAGRVVFVTGGASGIGFAMGEVFGADGYRVALLDVAPSGRKAAAALVARGIEATFFQADVSSAEAVRSAIQSVRELWGRLDCVINNAGILGPCTTIDDLDEKEFDRVLEVNLRGVMLVCKFAMRVQKELGGGTILNVASISARTGSAWYPAYSAAKAGVIALTRSIARRAGRHNVRVICISPGSILGTGLQPPRDREQRRNEMIGLLGKIPLRRVGRGEDVAQLALFLASSAARHIHGAVVTIDGGESLGAQ